MVKHGARHDARPAPSFPPYTISNLPKIASKTPVSSYFQTLACASKAPTVSNSASLKSFGMSLSFQTRSHFSSTQSNTVRHCKSIYSALFYVYTPNKNSGIEGRLPLWDDFVLSELTCLCPRFVHSFVGFRIVTLFRFDGRDPHPRFFCQNQPPSCVPSLTKASKSVSAKTFALANALLQPLPHLPMPLHRTVARTARSRKSRQGTIHMRNDHALPCYPNPPLAMLLPGPPP